MIIVGALFLGAAYIVLKPSIEARLAQSASFGKPNNQNTITVRINGKTIQAVLDSGSNLTLLTFKDASALGLIGGQCDPLPISGISANAESFCKKGVTMQVGDTQPFKTWVGVAPQGNPLPDNLFGQKDMDKFNISISKNEIKFSQAHTGCDSGVCMLEPRV